MAPRLSLSLGLAISLSGRRQRRTTNLWRQASRLSHRS
jgi:hypothetical protein